VTRSGRVPLVLASGSAGRHGLLQSSGIDPEVVISGVDETCDEQLETSAMVAILAERKASAVATLRPDDLVLGCDSMLDFDRQALGKPPSAEHAISMWQRLSGAQGTLYTGHCLIDGRSGRRVQAVAATVVRFGRPSEAELAAYVGTGEPMAMAGAFSIDGRGAAFVEGIDGDPSNVIGLSLPLLRRLLAELGIAITDLWRAPAGLPGGSTA
jgi:septum formation protein